MLDYIAHYGVGADANPPGRGSGRYPKGSGKRPRAGYSSNNSVKSKVNKTAESIRKQLTLKPSKITDEATDLNVVKARGSLTDREAESVLKLANDIYKNARSKEPRITNDVVNAVSSVGSKMYGLEYRLKQRNSLAAKIGSDSKSDGISFKEAANGINDAIRYTAVSDTQNFTKAYKSIKTELTNAGYSELKCKNYFTRFREGKVSHKAIQSVFESPDGTAFELQFQTPQSQAVKELKLPLYNEVRQISTSEDRRSQLINQMNQLGKAIDDPKGVFTIEEHNIPSSLKHSVFLVNRVW